MKKKISVILCVIMVFTLICLFFTSCKGGKSAYELAVEGGFNGTLEQWLESLKGADGKDGKNGFDGVDGQDGADGSIGADELYAKAVDEWGFKGDYLDFLDKYLTLNADSSAAASKALMSAVKVKTVNYYRKYGRDYSITSAGSGVIYQLNKSVGSAYIITNYHIVYNGSSTKLGGISDEISVFLYGKEQAENAIPARYIGGAYDCDIAILYVEQSDIIKNSEAQKVDVASSKDVALGQIAIAVGNPSQGGVTDNFQDVKISVTQGVVSVDSEIVPIRDTDIGYSISTRVMRVDTAINTGNSGGGLYDANGKLIGIVNAKSTASGVESMGYAIPADVVVGIANYAIEHCDGVSYRHIKKLDIGVTSAINSSKAVYDNVKKQTKFVEEIVVGGISENSPSSGILQIGDVIEAVEIGGVRYEVNRSFALDDALWNAKEGQTTSIKVYIARGGESTCVTLSVSQNDFVQMR